MLRPCARVGRAPVVVPLQIRVPAIVVALLLALSGCGSNDKFTTSSDEPSKDAVACRKEWKGLAAKVGGRDSLTNPSALAARWNSISATIDYYATSASGNDCGKTKAQQEKAMEALKTFSAKLAPYDMELRLEGVKSDAQAYAAGPRPPAPKPSKPPKGKKNKKKQKPAPRAPRPADIATALKTLTTQAPLASEQQGPGWEQARVAELGDSAAVKKAVKDLAFLSTESQAYRTSAASLALIKKALNATD